MDFSGKSNEYKTFIFVHAVAIVHEGSVEILNSSPITSREVRTKHITYGRNSKEIYDHNVP